MQKKNIAIVLAALLAAPVVVRADPPRFLECLVIEADTSWQLDGGVRHVFHGEEYRGPTGRIAISLEPQLTRSLAARIGVEHRSFPFRSSDRGEERVSVGLVWRPFRKGGAAP